MRSNSTATALSERRAPEKQPSIHGTAKSSTRGYPHLAEALRELPAETVVDGEVVALDDSGRPDFHAVQHFKASASRIHYFVFDLLVLHGRDLTNMPLTKRRELMKSVLTLPSQGIRVSEQCVRSSNQETGLVQWPGRLCQPGNGCPTRP